MKQTIRLIAGTILSVCLMMNGASNGFAMSETIDYDPDIYVTEDRPVVVYTGAQSTMLFHLDNDKPYQAKNISVVPDMSMTNLVGFKLMNTRLNLSDTNLLKGRPIEARLEVVIDDTVTEGTYPIKLVINYDNIQGDPYKKEILTYFEVRNDPGHKDQFTIYEPNATTLKVVKGEAFQLKYSLRNFEDYTVTNVKTFVEGLPTEHMALTSSKEIYTFASIKKNVIKTVNYTYLPSKDLPSGNYPYKIVYEYVNDQGNKITRYEAYSLYVGEGMTRTGDLQVTSTSNPMSVAQEGSFEVAFELTNKGEGVLKDLQIRLKEDSVFVPKSMAITNIKTLGFNETYVYVATLVATGEGLVDRNYPLSFDVTYLDGQETLTETITLGIYVKAKEENDQQGNAPKIIISDYVATPQIVQAGAEFDLSLDFMNTNKIKSIYNVKAFITSNDTSKEAGNVFTPVGSSNTFYIDVIAPKEASNQVIRLFTVPDAAPKTYTIAINFEYEDADGNPYTATEYVGIPVSQVTKVEASDFNMPAQVFPGEGVSVYFDIFNTGKAKVYNLLVKAEGNFVADPLSRYVGNFEAGSSDYFDAYVNFFEPGLVEGKFVISYEDAIGEQFFIEKPFTVNVMEGFDQGFPEGEFFPEPMPENQMGGPGLIVYVGIGLGLIAMIVVMIIALKRRKKKKMEMMFDEDQ